MATAPKCSTCGVSEWQHLCSGQPGARRATKPTATQKSASARTAEDPAPALQAKVVALQAALDASRARITEIEKENAALPEKSSGENSSGSRRSELPASFTKWREGLRLSQEEAAERLGVSSRTVMNWERAEKADKPIDRLIYLALAGLDATTLEH